MASQATPSKRPFQNNYSDHGGRGKWKKTKHASSQHAQLKIQPGVPAFRVLCPSSKSGNVIGKEGSVIAKICQETGAKISVEEAVPGCDERVIFIIFTDKDKETNHEQHGENNEGVAVPVGGDSVNYKDSSKAENTDSDREHGKEKSDAPEKDSIKEEIDDSDKQSSKEDNDDTDRYIGKEEKDDQEKDSIKKEIDDSDKHRSNVEDNDDSEKDNVKQEKDDLEKDSSKEEIDDSDKHSNNDSEKDNVKKENDDSAEDHLKEIHNSEKDKSKEEKDRPLAAKETKTEPEREIPSALKALLLVFDRIFATEDENKTGVASDARRPVSIRLLVLYNQAGWLLGKNGSVVKKMSADNGCEIRVAKDNLPSCALSQDRLCEITGEVDSVRKGLNAVAEVLFAHPPKENDAAGGAHLSGSSSHSLFNRSDGLPSGRQSNFQIPFQNMAPYPTLPEAQPHGHALAAVPVEPLTFRLLCSKAKVGSIIGKGGKVVNNIQKDTGCEIKVLETSPKSEDRIIRISGPAHPGDGISPAQNAILIVRKIVFPASDKEGPPTCRLIVSPNQVGCLLGKGGSIIAEMRKLSGAHIVVLSKDKIPKGVPQNDEVIQINGDCEAIQEALMQITARLRNHLFRDRMPAAGPNMWPPFGMIDSQFGPYMGSHESPSMFPKDFMGRPLDGIPAPWTMKGMPDVGDMMPLPEIPGGAQRGLGGFAGPGQSSLMPNVTAEVLVPRLVIRALCGEGGGCLDRICEFSEAKITVAEPMADAMDAAVLISGTPEQMHAARSLIQAFVLSESFAA